jgi:hypothetical protein
VTELRVLTLGHPGSVSRRLDQVNLLAPGFRPHTQICLSGLRTLWPGLGHLSYAVAARHGTQGIGRGPRGQTFSLS